MPLIESRTLTYITRIVQKIYPSWINKARKFRSTLPVPGTMAIPSAPPTPWPWQSPCELPCLRRNPLRVKRWRSQSPSTVSRVTGCASMADHKPRSTASRQCLRENAPGEIRTHGPRIRNPVLYPTELRGHKEYQLLTVIFFSFRVKLCLTVPRNFCSAILNESF